MFTSVNMASHEAKNVVMQGHKDIVEGHALCYYARYLGGGHAQHLVSAFRSSW